MRSKTNAMLRIHLGVVGAVALAGSLVLVAMAQNPPPPGAPPAGAPTGAKAEGDAGAKTNPADIEARARERVSRTIRLSWYVQERDRLDLSGTWYSADSLALPRISGATAGSPAGGATPPRTGGPATPAPATPGAPGAATPPAATPPAGTGTPIGMPPGAPSGLATGAAAAPAAGPWPGLPPTGPMPNRPTKTFLYLSRVRGGPASLATVDGTVHLPRTWTLNDDGTLSLMEGATETKLTWYFEGSRNRVRLVGGPFGETGETFVKMGAGSRNAAIRAEENRRVSIERVISGYWIGRAPFIAGGQGDVLFYIDPIARTQQQPRFIDGDNLPSDWGVQHVRQGTLYRSYLYVRTLDGTPLLERYLAVSQLGLGLSRHWGSLPTPVGTGGKQTNGYYEVSFDLAAGRVVFTPEQTLRRLTVDEYDRYVRDYRAKREAEIRARAVEIAAGMTDKPYTSPAPSPKPSPAGTPPVTTPRVPGGTATGAAAGAPIGARGTESPTTPPAPGR